MTDAKLKGQGSKLFRQDVNIKIFNRELRLNVGAVVLSVAAVVLILILFLLGHRTSRSTSDEDLEAGISYIRSLETKGTAEVEQQIKAVEREEMRLALEQGEIDVWQMLNDTVILGDSRAVGFYVFEYIEQRRVLAEAGSTIRNIEGHIPELEALNPSVVVLSYGINDMNIGFWGTVEEYMNEYAQIVQKLQSELPDTAIYINSIIPVTEQAFSQGPKWQEIPDWNSYMKQYCAENNIHFIDVSDTVEQHNDLHDPGDGIHMQSAFYPYWAMDIVLEVFEGE